MLGVDGPEWFCGMQRGLKVCQRRGFEKGRAREVYAQAQAQVEVVVVVAQVVEVEVEVEIEVAAVRRGGKRKRKRPMFWGVPGRHPVDGARSWLGSSVCPHLGDSWLAGWLTLPKRCWVAATDRFCWRLSVAGWHLQRLHLRLRLRLCLHLPVDRLSVSLLQLFH
jgi:hypothetical protein